MHQTLHSVKKFVIFKNAMNRQGPEWERRETARIFNKYKTGIPDSEDEEERN